MRLEDSNWPFMPLAAISGVSGDKTAAPSVFKGPMRVASWGVTVSIGMFAWIALGVALQFAASAAPANSAVVFSPAGYTADLTYQQTEEVLVSRPLGFKLQTAPFPKEPALPGQNVVRGMLWAWQRPDRALPFIWDKGRGRLFLDLNRNRDFTDDPKGAFASAAKENSQTFTNIDLVLPTAAGNHPLRLQLTFNSYGGPNMNVLAGLCSFWQARINLHGGDWQFGLLEGFQADSDSVPLEYVLLRPWAERQRPYNLLSSSPDFCNFTKGLFFGNRAYELDWRFEPGGNVPKYRVMFKEQTPQLGELQVSGADLHRLILTAKPGMTLLLDKPTGTLNVPIGSYSLDEIWLRKGDFEVMRLNAGKVTVDAQHAATLVAGGPLTNSIEARSARDTLVLLYKLLGADGGAYQFPRPDYQHPPEFAVFQGPNRLGGDKFRYG